MSKIIDDAVAALKEKMSNTSFEGSAKFEIETEGSIELEEVAYTPLTIQQMLHSQPR